MKMTSHSLPPLVPADAGTQPLPNTQTVGLGKAWIPASAGMNGDVGSLVA
jgi:hypothetical protein